MDETYDNELDLYDNNGWDSVTYDKKIDWNVDSNDRFDDWIHFWLKVVANIFKVNVNFVYDFVLYFSFT